MCNLYSLSHRLQAILEMVASMTKDIGNFGPMPGIFPDYSAPILRAQADGSLELAMARWGMPSSKRALFEAATKRADKLRAKGKPVDFDELLRMEPDKGTTNIRRTESRHWWPWLGPQNRCLVPFTSFNEPDQVNRTESVWFALGEDRPLAFFAGVWTPHACVRKISTSWEEFEAFGFLTTDASPHPGAHADALAAGGHRGDVVFVRHPVAVVVHAVADVVRRLAVGRTQKRLATGGADHGSPIADPDSA